MNTQSKTNNNMTSGSPSNAGQMETTSGGERTLEWQANKSQSSTTTTRGTTGGGGRRSEKKPEHNFSNSVPNSRGHTMQQYMREGQGPGGTAPWTPVWTFPKGGGGKQK